LLKLSAVLLLSIFAYGSVPALAAAAAAISAGAVIAGIRPRELLRGSRPVLFLALLILLLRVIEWDAATPFLRIDTTALGGGLAQGLSMIVSFAGGALLFAVTTMRELCGGLGGRGDRPDRRRRAGIFRLGLALSLMLSFLPRFFEIWEETNLALEARCAEGRIRRLLLAIPPVIDRMIEKALDTALALESRGLDL
jgi:biotin transport system permease protein